MLRLRTAYFKNLLDFHKFSALVNIYIQNWENSIITTEKYRVKSLTFSQDTDY